MEAVALAADEIVASARTKQVAVLATELGQLRVKIFTLGASASLPDSGSASCCSAASSVGFS